MIAIGHLSMLSKHEANQRLHGLSGVGIDSTGSGWPLGGAKTRMESSVSKDTSLAKSTRLLSFLSPLSISPPPFFFVVILLLLLLPLHPLLLLFLASAQYLMRTNYVAVLIRPLGCNL